MPYYSFSNPNNEEETKLIFFHMNDEKKYSENGVEWVRNWHKPLMAVDSKWDCDSSKDFIEKTARKVGTIGDLQNKAKELSEQRKAKRGYDEVETNYFKNYSKHRKGKRHVLDRPKKISGAGFEVDLS